METDNHQCGCEYQQTESLKPYILICPDHIGVFDHNTIHKSSLSTFLALKLIEGVHESGVFGVAFGTVLYS